MKKSHKTFLVLSGVGALLWYFVFREGKKVAVGWQRKADQRNADLFGPVGN